MTGGGSAVRRRGRRLLSFATLAVLADLQLAGSCVDGVTPDCGDGAACGPATVDAAGDAIVILDGAPLEGAASGDAASEASDAADGG
jgi:hypothetical protein